MAWFRGSAPVGSKAERFWAPAQLIIGLGQTPHLKFESILSFRSTNKAEICRFFVIL